MNYLSQLNEKISLFQIISCINSVSLFLNFGVLTIFRRTMKAKGSVIRDFKMLLQSDEEDSSGTLVRISTGMILIFICSIVITILSCWLGFEFFLKATMVMLIVVPGIDCLPILTDCYLNGKSYNKESYFLMVVSIKTFFVNITISIATLICEWLDADTVLFQTNGNQVLKIFLIALLVALILGVVYAVSNSIYSIWSYTFSSKTPDKICENITKYSSLEIKNEEKFNKRIKDIDFDARVHPYVLYRFFLSFRFFGVVLILKFREIYYSSQLLLLTMRKQYVISHSGMLTYENYRHRINIILRVALIVLLLTTNVLLALSINGYEICAKVYELISTVIIIPIILDSLPKKK
ncbi:MAG: hypothetical protein E7662_00500 [Ruminococcaceae bacterium]|nr:hypothetical protein [Oscillospiraceae bacterium]